ncbi:MAG: 4Fe-4S dicluster domain-containing protein [Eubacteriales bacterium]
MRRNIRGGIILPISATKNSLPVYSLSKSFSIGWGTHTLPDGARVRIGDPIGAIGDLPVLSPITGTVHSDGSAISIHADAADTDNDGEVETQRYFGAPEGKGVLELSPADLIQAVRDAAIPCDESREPLAAKLSRSEGRVYQIAIAAFDCQPYMHASSTLVGHHPDKLVNALKILMSVLGAGTGRILLPLRGKGEKGLHKAIGSFSGKIRIQRILPAYPANRERLVYSLLTGRELSYQKTPEEAGILILSPIEAAAISDLFLLNKPFTHTLVCVDGPLIGDPGCLWTPVGTRISDLLEQCCAGKSGILIENGLMDGHQVDREDFVTPYTRSLTLIEKTAKRTPTACIGCNRCFAVCPMYLSPKRILATDSDADSPLGRIFEAYRSDPRQKLNSIGCIGCGCCSYVCPAGLPLRDRMQQLKGEYLKTDPSSKEAEKHE